MKYKFMLLIAFFMAILSSLLTAFGMAELFLASGWLILILFVTIDLGRFILFNFTVDEWKNLRFIKYFTILILAILFIYSGVGIYAKLSSLISAETKQAMITMSSTNLADINAKALQTQNTDFTIIAKTEYENALNWNKKDHENCLTRAQKAEDIAEAENKCNNTKRRLDKNALAKYEASLKEMKQSFAKSEETSLAISKNQSEIASILSTVCKLTHKECTSYSDFEDALTLIILLVIIGTDYLQICIVLSINTRKNKQKEMIKPMVTKIYPENTNITLFGNIKGKFTKLKDKLINTKLLSKFCITLLSPIKFIKILPQAARKVEVRQDPITFEKKVVTKKIEKNTKKMPPKMPPKHPFFIFSGAKPNNKKQ